MIVTLGLFSGCERSNPDQLQGYVEGEFRLRGVAAGRLAPNALRAAGRPSGGGRPALRLGEHAGESRPGMKPRRVWYKLVRAWRTPRKADGPRKSNPSRPSSAKPGPPWPLRRKSCPGRRSYPGPERPRRRTSTAPAPCATRCARRRLNSKRISRPRSLGPAATKSPPRKPTSERWRPALTAAEWNLTQKSQAAPQAGLIFDTMYRQGEWVPAGRPVVALLPPQNIKVRAFVPETQVHALHQGDRVQVIVDGTPGRWRDGSASSRRRRSIRRRSFTVGRTAASWSS